MYNDPQFLEGRQPPVTEIPEDILEDFTYGYKEKVKSQDRKYI